MAAPFYESLVCVNALGRVLEGLLRPGRGADGAGIARELGDGDLVGASERRHHPRGQ